MIDKVVAWTMLDGNTMCGRVTAVYFGRLHVTRFDDGTCTIDAERVRPATDSDITSAFRFFANIGK